MSKATEAMSKIVQRTISPELSKVLDFEEFGLSTLTGVVVTRDFDFADCYVSVMKNKKNLKEKLRENVYFIQQTLNKHLKRKKVPKIRFFVDAGPEHAEKVEKYLRD